MKKIIKVSLVIATAFLIAACNTAGNNSEGGEISVPPVSNTPAQPPHQAMVPTLEPVQQMTPPDEPIPDLFPPSGFYFTLTEEERAAYERLKAELTTDAFYGLSPISVAKIYVQAGIDGEWEAEWTAHNYESMEVTKEEFYDQHLIDMMWSEIASRQSLANWVFPFIDDAEVFIEGNRAMIVFDSVPEPDVPEEHQDTLHVFNLIKNDAGIWEMRFRPHAIIEGDIPGL